MKITEVKKSCQVLNQTSIYVNDIIGDKINKKIENKIKNYYDYQIIKKVYERVDEIYNQINRLKYQIIDQAIENSKFGIMH